MKKILFYLLLALLVALPFSSANFDLKNYSMTKSYVKNSSLIGWMNISFTDQDAQSRLSSNFPGGIALINFLNLSKVNFTCYPKDCKTNYILSDPQSVKTFALSPSQNKMVALSITTSNKIRAISDLSFNITVDNEQSCTYPLYVDILNDLSSDWTADKFTDDFSCSPENQPLKGCFDESKSSATALIGSKYFCERVNVLKSQRYKLNAVIKRNLGETGAGLKMTLQDLSGRQILGGSCDILDSSIEDSNDWQEVGCVVDQVKYVQNDTQNIYVCVKSLSEAAVNAYYIKQEAEAPTCGFYNTLTSTTEFQDFNLYVTSAKYEVMGDLSINKAKNPAIVNNITSYIASKYGNNCSSECIIPIKFVSNSISAMDIEVSNPKMNVETNIPTEVFPKINDALESNAVISSGNVILNLANSNITLNARAGNYVFNLLLGGEELFSQDITILNISEIKSIFPNVVIAKKAVEFSVELTDYTNISQYLWDFGDNTALQTTYNNSAVHTYSSIGSFNIKVEITTPKGKTSKTFPISVTLPISAINSTIKEYEANLNAIETQISGKWYKENLKSIISFSKIRSELTSLKSLYSLDKPDNVLLGIMGNLTLMRVPISLLITPEGTPFPYYVDYESINLANLAEAGTVAESKEEEYRKSISAWNSEYINYSLFFEYVSAIYPSSTEDTLTAFRLKLEQIKSPPSQVYLVIEGQGINISGDISNVRNLENGVSIKLSSLNTEVSFTMPGDVLLEDVIIYASPLFSKLSAGMKIEACDRDRACESTFGENWKNCISDCRPIGMATFLMVIIVLGTFIFYIFLEILYKSKYEHYLFKSKSDLYNILNFINNAISQGISEKEIKERLKRSNWKGEQIDYAIKKVKGKALMPLDFLKLFKGMPKKMPDPAILQQKV